MRRKIYRGNGKTKIIADKQVKSLEDFVNLLNLMTPRRDWGPKTSLSLARHQQSLSLTLEGRDVDLHFAGLRRNRLIPDIVKEGTY